MEDAVSSLEAKLAESAGRILFGIEVPAILPMQVPCTIGVLMELLVLAIDLFSSCAYSRKGFLRFANCWYQGLQAEEVFLGGCGFLLTKSASGIH